MNHYAEKLTVPVSSQIPWEALKSMNIWLPKLSTNKTVKYDTSKDFFVVGTYYEVETKEGITMKSELFKIDEKNLTVEIHAKWFLLRSYLTCQVKPINDTLCKIVSTSMLVHLFGIMILMKQG